MRDCCKAIQDQFGTDYALEERKRLDRKGPIRTTRWLIDAIVEAGVDGATVLDVGAGPGAVTEALLHAGASQATHVEVSLAQSQAARERAEKVGNVGRIRFEVGDFVEIASDVDAAEVVVLDRVICCYPNMEALLSASAGKARRLYAAVYPRERASVRLMLTLINLSQRLRRRAFRAYVHPIADMHARLRDHGFSTRTVRRTFAWEVALFERGTARS